MAQRPVDRGVGQVFAFVGAKGGVGTTTVAVNVATALAKRRKRATLLIDLHVAERRRGGVPRRRAALLDRRRAREHAPARRGVLPRPGHEDASRGVDLLASSDRLMVAPLDVRTDSHADRLRRAALPLRRARRAALRRGDARRARGGDTDHRRRQSGAGDGAEREPHGGGAAAALRQGPGHGRGQPRRSARGNRARRHRACGRLRASSTVSRATTGARSRR